MYNLRELERSDMTMINTWRNDSELIARLGAPFRRINSEVDDAWFDSYMDEYTYSILSADYARQTEKQYEMSIKSCG